MKKIKPPVLILDCHYICHRLFWSMGRALSWNGVATGVIYGFLKSLSHFKNEFQTDSMAFCFESRKSLRRELFPEYKARRLAKQEEDPELKAARLELHRQIGLLRDRYLPDSGFRNIFTSPGYESDDLMAALAASLRPRPVVLITSDEDLFQCLDDHVQIYSPQPDQKARIMTRRSFMDQYGIKPERWSLVKAMAGCSTDGVPGIKGIGETTALKYLRGELKPTSKAAQLLSSKEARRIIDRNLPLVKLPFKSCPVPEMQSDRISNSGWNAVCRQLGIRQLINRPPNIAPSLLIA